MAVVCYFSSSGSRAYDNLPLYSDGGNLSYLSNTLKLSVYGLLWGFPVPIILALLLNRVQSPSIKRNVQLVLYLPNFISVIVVCGIVRILFSVTGDENLIKAAVTDAGYEYAGIIA